MQIPVLIEPVEGNGFRATGGDPFALTADGSTREEALLRLRTLIEDRLGHGAQIVSLDVSGASSDHPWTRFAGIFANEPFFDEWQEAIRDYRRQADEDPDLP